MSTEYFSILQFSNPASLNWFAIYSAPIYSSSDPDILGPFDIKFCTCNLAWDVSKSITIRFFFEFKVPDNATPAIIAQTTKIAIKIANRTFLFIWHLTATVSRVRIRASVRS